MKARIQSGDPGMGPLFDWALDHRRIETQLDRIRDMMMDKKWRTVEEISAILETRFGTKFPAPSVQADLRHLRKAQFGGYHVLRRRRSDGALFEYAVHDLTCHCLDCLSELQRKERRNHQEAA